MGTEVGAEWKRARCARRSLDYPEGIGEPKEVFVLVLNKYVFIDLREGRDRNIYRLPTEAGGPAPTGDPAHNLGMCPDWN